MSVDVREATALSVAFYKACIPLLKDQDGEQVIYAMYMMAAAVTYHGIAGVETISAGVQFMSPSLPPDGLIRNVTLATSREAIRQIAVAIAPKNPEQN